VTSAELAGARDESSPPVQTSSSRRLSDSLPLVSRVAGMLRGLRFNVAAQRLDDQTATPGDDDVTAAASGNDVNDNEEKSRDDDDDDGPPLPAEAASRKTRASRRAKKTGKKDRDRDSGGGGGRGGEKHQRMEEDNSTDSDEDLTGKTAHKLATQMSEKGERLDTAALASPPGEAAPNPTTLQS